MEETNTNTTTTSGPIRPPRIRDTTTGDHSSTSSSTTEPSSSFRKLVQSAFAATAAAQTTDASGAKERAFKEYDAALQLIDKALSSTTHPQVDEDDTLIYQLRCTRKEILERVSDLQTSSTTTQGGGGGGGSTSGGVVLEERQPGLPPAYDYAEVVPPPHSTGGGSSRRPYDPLALAAALDEISMEEERDWTRAGPLPLNALEVYSIPGEVQIYFISAEDNVSAPSYPSFLRLVTMEPDGGGEGSGSGGGGVAVVAASVPAFLQVGDYTYPLIPGHSPVFRSTEGIYIFPDLSSNVPGSYVGLILPDAVDAEGRRKFEETLLGLVGVDRFPPVLPPPSSQEELQVQQLQHEQRLLQEQELFSTKGSSGGKEKPPRPPAPIPNKTLPPKEQGEETEEEEGVVVVSEEVVVESHRRLSTKIAEGLITGAEAVSRGLYAVSSKTSSFLDRGATYINSRIEPSREKPVVKPEVKAGMKTAKSVTGKAVQLSGFIVTQVGRGTIALGRHMAPHVHKASTKLLARTVCGNDEVDASAKVDQMLEVTTGAVVGFGTVYFGLEHAGRTLVSSLANNSVRIVQHRYGDEVGECTADGLGCAGNAALTAWNTKNLAPKAVAKRVAKDTGRMVVKAHQEKGAAAVNKGGVSGGGGSKGGPNPSPGKEGGGESPIKGGNNSVS